MLLYSPVFLAVTAAAVILPIAVMTAFNEYRLRAALCRDHIKLKDGKNYIFWTGCSLCLMVICAFDLRGSMESALRQRELLVYMPENFFAALTEYDKYSAYMTRYDGQVGFYLVMMIIYLVLFIWMLLYAKNRFGGTYLTKNCIIRGGTFYKREKITYGFDNYIILIYNRKGKKILEITTADSGELDAARNFLGKYYTSISERERFYAEA